MVMILLTGCFMNSGGDQQNIEPPDQNQDSCKGIVIDEAKYDASVLDDYLMKYAFIEGDTLSVIVQYGGGCGSANFTLITNGQFMESDPVQLDVVLAFQDEDPCEALIQKSICFDISALADLYNDSYQTSGGTIIIRLKNYDDQIGYVF
jgi:hypothetical protein